MSDPLDLAHRRQAAVEALQAQLSGHVDEAQRSLLEGLLARLTDLHTDPGLLPLLLADYQATVALPLALFYAHQVLSLPALSESYFADLGAECLPGRTHAAGGGWRAGRGRDAAVVRAELR